MSNRKPRGGLVGPISLIFLGIVFLVHTLGIYEIDFWDLFLSLWPLFLIALGVDILIGYRSRAGTLISALIIVALFTGGLYLYYESQAGSLARATEGNQFQQELDEVERAKIIIEPGVGVISVSELLETKFLISSTVSGWDPESILTEHRTRGNVGLYRIGILEGFVFVPPFTGANMPTWDVGVTSLIPIELIVENGIGEQDIDLTDLNISGVTIEYGVGRSVITMPAVGNFNATLSGGVGLQEVRIPRSLAVRVTTGRGLVLINFPDEFILKDGFYYSPNYATSDHRVNVLLEQGIGSLTLSYLAED